MTRHDKRNEICSVSRGTDRSGDPAGKLYKKSNGRRKDFSQPDSATM